jgi:uncharacterized protein (DUF924 family)
MIEGIGPEHVLRFWFGEPGAPPLVNSEKWFAGGANFDAECKEQFGALLDRVQADGLDDWRKAPRGRLALVVLCDQLARNVFRGTPRAFAMDSVAREVASQSFDAGDGARLSPVEVSFLLMPFVHAEDLVLQDRCVEGFANLIAETTGDDLRAYFANAHKYAKLHQAIVARFGRFPHRNAILGRTTTPEEAEFLKQPHSSF